MTTDLVPYTELQQMAVDVVRSRMFPGITTPEAAMTLFLICQSEGLHPMQAMMRYHVIQGRPAMKADAMLAEFMRRGGTVKWKEWTNEACEATFTSTGCPDGVSVRWTMDDARRAGVTGNPTWTKYPRQMLKARVASDGVRMADPAVNQGRYTPEEVQDFDDHKGTRVPAEAEIMPPVASQDLESQLQESLDRVAAGKTPVPSKAEILDRTSLDVEEKPLRDVLARGKELAADALQKLETPRECDQCGAEVKRFPSASKEFPGRMYWQCEGAHFEIEQALEQGVRMAKAKTQVKEHYGCGKREWAEAPGRASGVGASENGDKQPLASPVEAGPGAKIKGAAETELGPPVELTPAVSGVTKEPAAWASIDGIGYPHDTVQGAIDHVEAASLATRGTIPLDGATFTNGGENALVGDKRMDSAPMGEPSVSGAPKHGRVATHPLTWEDRRNEIVTEANNNPLLSSAEKIAQIGKNVEEGLKAWRAAHP